MKVRLVTLLSGAALLAAQSAGAAVSYDEAAVTAVMPIYRVVETSSPRQECWQEEVVRQDMHDRSDRSYTPGILGMVIGGALGNAVGNNSSSRKVGTVVGAMLGGSVARDIGRSNDARRSTVYVDTEERCRTVYNTRQEEKLVGYDVSYRYNGVERTVRMPDDPGATVRVRVDVEPVL
jgi:uncharacterized protein YcfJ